MLLREIKDLMGMFSVPDSVFVASSALAFLKFTFYKFCCMHKYQIHEYTNQQKI